MDATRILFAVLIAACGGDKARPQTAAPVRVSAVDEPVRMDRSKDADAVTRRFGVAVPAGVAVKAANTKLAAPVMLVATHVSTDEQLSFATVVNKQTGGGGYYGVGDEIPTAGRVTRIAPRRIAYVDGGGETCMLELLPEADAPATPANPLNSAVDD